MATGIILVTDGDPADRGTNSGVAVGIAAGLRETPAAHLVGAVNGRPAGLWKAVLAVVTARPSRERWRSAYRTSAASVLVRSLVVRQRLRRERLPRSAGDVVLYVRSLYLPGPGPYAVFLDATGRVSQRGWPAWFSGAGRLRWRLEARTYRRAVCVFTASEYVRQSVIADYGVPAERVVAVGGGLNLPVAATAAPAGSAPPGPRPRVLFVGKDFSRKGGDVLVAAVRILRAGGLDVELDIVGTQVPIAEPWVKVHGLVSSPERMAQFYREASVFCLPARFEPFGLVFLEALAFGVPCVGSSVGAIPEILHGGSFGTVVPENVPEEVARAIGSVLADGAGARARAQLGRQYVMEAGKWSTVAGRLVEGLERSRRSGAGDRAPIH